MPPREIFRFAASRSRSPRRPARPPARSSSSSSSSSSSAPSAAHPPPAPPSPGALVAVPSVRPSPPRAPLLPLVAVPSVRSSPLRVLSRVPVVSPALVALARRFGFPRLSPDARPAHLWCSAGPGPIPRTPPLFSFMNPGRAFVCQFPILVASQPPPEPGFVWVLVRLPPVGASLGVAFLPASAGVFVLSPSWYVPCDRVELSGEGGRICLWLRYSRNAARGMWPPFP